MKTTQSHEQKSFCRICTGHCGVFATTDDEGRLTAIRGDKNDPQTLGFICSKGTDAVDSHNSPQRILRPLKRRPDGTFEAISKEQALTEIAAKLSQLIDQNGPNAIAAYRGSGGFFASASMQILNAWMEGLGSYQMYSNLTIDQSAKWVAMGRLGYWPPGTQHFSNSDVCMLIGNNPLVSVAGSGFDTRHPLKRIREAKARGMKLIVIDPRRTETAEYADVFVQPLPGNDAAILAAIIHIVIEQGWYDREFCDTHVADFDRLKSEVASFQPDQVEADADIPAGILFSVAKTFAFDSKRGAVATGTGPSMSPYSNLMEQLAGVLNVICGRYVREGEAIANPGLILGWQPKPAQVVNIGRSWESGPKSKAGGFGTIGGEMLTPILADEILLPGENQIKALFSVGGNPVAAIPDQNKVVKAFKELDLLVSLEPFMTPTAALSDYILPPRMPYERADTHLALFESAIYGSPYARYTAPVAKPPAGSELCDEWSVFWTLAKKLNLQLSINGKALDMNADLSDDQLLAMLVSNSPVDFDTLKSAESGYTHPEELFAQPADPATMSHFTTMPDDVIDEMKALRRSYKETLNKPNTTYTHRLSTRRNRHRFNTIGHYSPYLKRLTPYNPAYMHPSELEAKGFKNGDMITITSDHGSIRAKVEADASVRPGVVSISHCFGDLPGNDDYDQFGSSTNQLISTDRNMETINAMPRMSGIPVAISAVTG